ncbi:hypothetical protein [Secundilactobacillus collinoides]|nr:hypothetical protein [Secundilactobacillus collinoides]
MNNAYQAQLALQVAFDCLLMFRHVAKKHVDKSSTNAPTILHDRNP